MGTRTPTLPLWPTFARRFLGAGMLLALASGCPGNGAAPPASAPGPGPTTTTFAQSKSGLGFRLSDASGKDEDHGAAAVTEGTPLSPADAAKVLGKLPALVADPEQVKAFALRAGSLPAPRAGKTVLESFPPPPSSLAPPATASGPLEVLRHAPEGDVTLAPELTVTFSQPMVPITSLSELAKFPPPVSVSPQPPGTWQWVGTQNALFKPEKRFPMATTYTVEVPAGARSANGGVLGKAARWTFQTPPPTANRKFPDAGPQRRDPVIFVSFDQAIEPAAVLASVHVEAAGEPVAVRLATPTEIETDKEVRRLVEKAEAGRWLAFRAAELLPADSSIDVTVGPGTPSAEGPRTTTKAQPFNFSTYGALTVTHAECSSAPEKCRPNDNLSLRFSNPLDKKKKFTRAMVHVTPEVHGLTVNMYGEYLNISGFFKGHTTYQVALDDAVPDEFGQTLTGKKTFTFDIGPAEPVVFTTGRSMEVLDPAAKGKLTVQTVNEKKLLTRIYAVQPGDFLAFQEYLQSRYNDGKKVSPPGRLVVDQVRTLAKNADEIVDTDVDLSPALKNGVGQVVVMVDPQPAPANKWEREPICTWIQVTRLGITTVVDPTDVYAYASDLAGGGPLAGVQLEVAGGASATTGADGVVKVPLGAVGAHFLVARRGEDVALLAQDWSPYSHLRSYGSTGDLVRHQTKDVVKWFVFDDRGTYKPKEDVKIKGFVRTSGTSKGGDLEMLSPNLRAFHWTALDARNAEIGKGAGTLDEQGQFDFGFHLADTVNLGSARVTLVLDSAPDLNGTSDSHSFQVQEFRRPEFEVTTSVSEGPLGKGHAVGEHAEVTVAATYYAGGGLPDAPVHWRVSRSVGHITPPNRSEYTFGDGTFDGFDFEESGVRPRGADDDDDSDGGGEPSPDKGATWDAKTHADGKHALRVDFDALEHPFPMGLHFSASVTDVNQQQWHSATSLVVRPSDVFVGMKLARGFVHAGDAVPLDVVVTDQDGAMTAGRPIDIELASVTWDDGSSFFGGRGKPTLKVVDRCQATSTNDVQHCALKTSADGGEFRLTATTKDAIGRRAETRMSVWAWGEHMPRQRTLDTEAIKIIPDKDEYLPGQTAEVLLIAPFPDGEALVTVRRQGVVSVQRATFKGSATALHILLTDALVPGAELAVEVVGKSLRMTADGTPDPKSLPRPAAAHGTTFLKVSAAGRNLTVTATPRDARIEPAGGTTVDIKVTASSGAPVPGAEMSLVVVDEAILALSGMKLPDPAAFFYGARPGNASESELRTIVDLLDSVKAGPRAEASLGAVGGAGRGAFDAPGEAPPPPPAMAPAPLSATSAAPQKAAMTRSKAREKSDDDADGIADETDKVSGNEPKMRLRTDFAALAAFVPRVITGADGVAHVPVKLPDSLTRYRVMAVVAAGPRAFGSAESTITARLPLMVRPSAPRFLNFGDRFDFPVVLQNQTDLPLVVKVAARADNATLDGSGGKQVTVPANDRVEVRLRAAAAKPGKARFQVAATSGRYADASETTLPVWTPATTEAFATYGVLDGDSATLAQPMKMPGDAVKSFGDVEITTSSTALQALTDAFLYLVRYPFECDEQISSRIMGVAALRDVLTAFQVAGMPSQAELVDTVGKDIERLKSHQRGDGGWGYWVRSEEDPYVSIHVAHALSRAKDKGFAVPAETITRALVYLAAIDQHMPAWYGPETRHALEAYALYTRARLGQVSPSEARAVLAASGGPNKVALEPLGWLIPVMSADPASQAVMTEVRRVLANRATETAGAAHFVTDYGDGDTVLLHSNRRADGVLLEAMIGDQPKSDLIPKLVTGLLGARKAGHWANTNEDAFVLLALDRYFTTYENQTPDFVARAWLGEGFAGEHAFKGHTTERSEIDVPLEQFAALGNANANVNLTLAKTGPGRLYYRVGMRYAPASLNVPPLERGFSVGRTYEPIDDPKDVRRDPDGTWHIKRGAQVRIRVTMAAPAERAHVALVDPLPAGLEAVNPELAVSAPVPADPRASRSPGWWWGGSWYEHQNMRDERAEAFASYLPAGVYDYSYVARATTPGTFVVPPPKAEEMYNPETFGRGAGDKVIVE